MPQSASTANESGLRIHLLGGCRISVGGRVIEPSTWRLRKAEALIKLGHKIQVTPDWSNSSAPTVILKRDGVLHGAADPRRARFVFGR